MTTTTQSTAAKVSNYILNAIDSQGYSSTHADTKQGKLQFLYETFKSEYGFQIKRLGEQNAMAEWISGLPSCFNIDFNYCDIIARAKELGSLPEGLTGKALEAREDKICANWFNWIAAETIMLIRKNA